MYGERKIDMGYEGTSSELESKYNDDTPLLKVPEINKKAFFGLIKEVIETAAVNCEASAVSVGITLIHYIAACIGRKVYLPIGDYILHCRPYSLIVGQSSKARKGMSQSLVKKIFLEIAQINKYLPPIINGLSTGEGLIYLVRDSDDKDQGISDKRALVIETEFANILKKSKREQSILSQIIRQAYDGETIATRTRVNSCKATDPHIVILGHITADELKKTIANTTEATNGFINRFLIINTKREKIISLPPATNIKKIKSIAFDINQILKEFDPLSKTIHEMKIDIEAAIYWDKVYSVLTAESYGIIGELTNRHDHFPLIYAMIFAILEGRFTITELDIERALYWVDYGQQSIRYIFSSVETEESQKRINELSRKILSLITDQPISRSQLYKALDSNVKADRIKESVQYLLNQSPPLIKQTSMPSTSKRPMEGYVRA